MAAIGRSVDSTLIGRPAVEDLNICSLEKRSASGRLDLNGSFIEERTRC